MNDTSLERILEEAFQTVLRSNFTLETLSTAVDLSFATTNVDVSFSTNIPQANTNTNTSTNIQNQLRDTHLLYQNYQENMRLYQNNVSMMVRHLQSVGRIANITRQRSRNSGDHELHSFPFYGIFPTVGSSESYDIPTINHFSRATEYCIYNRETMSDSRSCPITLDEFQENEQVCRIRHCGHIFKSNALQNWFSRNAHCPVCRYDIRSQSE